ncbi:hypothetical protein BDP81DRAFT_37532 [Colletotrichum phormii]|uniref:Uncharacterized protein n=1 Tax=Colletotrichum phormii TaxID=359342 RepID=A0AAJ0EGX3_9PEZI|nr:uncharacterized protein BDP81DRAFT_37532 [Colletotrichum phormii]KAK1636400.1 hypothetical protein BDP81DRAFT_37532 [Colletotrichum phormii]
MSAEDHEQGSRDQLIPHGEASAPFERLDDRQTRVQETLNQISRLIPSQSPTQPPHFDEGEIEEPPTSGRIAGHAAGPGASTPPSTAQRTSVSAGQLTLTTPPTAVSNTDATRDAGQANFLVCVVFLMFGATAAPACRKEFNRACDLKLHTWRFHVHIDDQRHIKATDIQRCKEHEATANQQPGPRPKGLKPDQAKQTALFLRKNPLDRFSIEDWYRFVDIIAILNDKRPRPEERHRNHRIACISKLWRSRYGHSLPDYGLHGKFRLQLSPHVVLCSPLTDSCLLVEVSKENWALIARSVRRAMDIVKNPEEECPKSFIKSEESFTDHSSNVTVQTEQVDFGGTWVPEVGPEGMEFIRNMSKEEMDYCITLWGPPPGDAGPASGQPREECN